MTIEAMLYTIYVYLFRQYETNSNKIVQLDFKFHFKFYIALFYY